MTGTWEMVVAPLAEPVLTPAVRQMGILVDSHVARGAWTAMGATVGAAFGGAFAVARARDGADAAAIEHDAAARAGGAAGEHSAFGGDISPPHFKA